MWANLHSEQAHSAGAERGYERLFSTKCLVILILKRPSRIHFAFVDGRILSKVC